MRTSKTTKTHNEPTAVLAPPPEKPHPMLGLLTKLCRPYLSMYVVITQVGLKNEVEISPSQVPLTPVTLEWEVMAIQDYIRIP